MEYIHMNPLTEALEKEIAGCRPSVNLLRGLSKWRKSLQYSHYTLKHTYAELMNVLPDNETYPDRISYRLSPFLTQHSVGRAMRGVDNSVRYWKYIKLSMQYVGYHHLSDYTFAVWGRDGKVRLAAATQGRGDDSTWPNTPKMMAFRLNTIMRLSWRKYRQDRDNNHPTMMFSQDRGRLCYVLPVKGSQFNTHHLPVTSGDVIDTNDWTVNSRLIAGLAPMRDITSDLVSLPTISEPRLQQFRQAPLNPAIRSAIRGETNVVLPDTVTDEDSLKDFFRQRRAIVSETGVFAI
tara:strand:+ start:5828 stop:6703 length:876 start_codon:yes stop_codon:yes gene_type:complete